MRTRRSLAGSTTLRACGLAAAAGLLRVAGAAAFPLIDPSNQDQVPQGTELAAPDVQDLRHQLQIVNGMAAPEGGGWTFVPRIDVQEMLTDNVEQAHSLRNADLVSYLAPGFSLVGDQPRVQMTLNYAPTLSIYTRTGSLDSLTEQLNGLGTVTLAPDMAFVDLRALAGVQGLYGGLGGLGSIGAPAGAGGTAQTVTPTLAGNAAGLTRNNEVQSASFAVSPYLLHSFGDWGVGKLGYSLGLTRSDTLSGFFAPPYPAGGLNGQTLLSNEIIGHYATGDILSFVQNSLDVDILHGQTSYDGTGATLLRDTTSSSSIQVSDKVSYALTHDLVMFGSGGHEDITYPNQVVSTTILGPNGPEIGYKNAPGLSIHDLTWSFGGTWTPNPDSSLTVSYGHLNGFNSMTVNGHYQATARTLLSVSYGSTLGTQLQYLQSQLDLAAPNGSGTQVNGATGGALYGAINALPVRDGVYRTDTLTVGSSTSLDRDIVSLNLLMTKQTGTGAGAISVTSKGASGTWLHQMQPDMTVSAAVSLAIQEQTAAGGSGDTTSVVASVLWQYHLSETLTASVRYSFLEQQASAAIYSVYQNMLILGISKTF